MPVLPRCKPYPHQKTSGRLKDLHRQAFSDGSDPFNIQNTAKNLSAPPPARNPQSPALLD
ncbi:MULTISPECIES: hypothetical protein [Neisseria]|uniref:hypothetical protein n=1 Tax=Neisseria TaxID=482 RepID=UPI001071ED87|nr:MULTISPECIES: hypothetical protein [Neisseria]MBF0803181.1 hypothetical protein [Neisseria sp. 19428wB4_WF04]TFU44155.1 hypothetical protein E4T99_02215 [Neisseria sp. WF04]